MMIIPIYYWFLPPFWFGFIIGFIMPTLELPLENMPRLGWISELPS
jgi:hypothetical protein